MPAVRRPNWNDKRIVHPAEPSGNELRIVIAAAPASLQSGAARKEAFRNKLRAALGEPQYLLTGEVSVEAEWLLPERIRYETLLSPDVDNTLKVTLDALCGPAGILVNDRQVQHVSCHWIDWTREDQQFTVVVKHRPDDWIRKHGLAFVEVINIDSIARMSDANQKLLELTGDWHLAQLVMPIQRPFHRGRLGGFRVLSLAEARREIGL
jgi:Holliday junction resolvase RusA-like endonuclease